MNNVFSVTENGIYIVKSIYDDFTVNELVLPKETFIEAFNEYILKEKEENNG